jgi:hypothetical protein
MGTGSQRAAVGAEYAQHEKAIDATMKKMENPGGSSN